MCLIKWSQIRGVPLEKRIQLFAVALWLTPFVIAPLIVTSLFIYYLIFGNFIIRSICLLYLIHIVANKDVGHTGGKGSGIHFLRKCKIWKYLADYFPVSLVKTADLPANRNYLFATFPHGIASYGVFCNFVSFRSKFQEYYPGLRTKVCTINSNFYIPVIRELLLSYGLATASERCIKLLLTASTDPKDLCNSDGFTANATVLVVGGAQEALYSRPNNYQIELKHRKGFVRLAIMTGSPLVPVFSFGEVDVYNQLENPPGSKLRKFQEYFKKFSGVSPIILKGRGLFQRSFGFIPQRKPITTVVGAPIDVTKNEHPTQEEIDEVHEKFIKALTDLFETHKEKYIVDAKKVKLIIE